MSLKDKLPSGGTPRERIGDGTFSARIVQILRLGTQEDEWKGEKKIGKKLWITYEIPEKTITIEDVEKPRWISKEINEVGGEKATLTKIIEAVSGHGEINEYEDMLGKPVTITVGTTSGGKDKVAGIAGVPTAFAKAIPELANPSVFWDIDNPDMEVFSGFPDFIKEMIQAAPEWEGEANPFA